MDRKIIEMYAAGAAIPAALIRGLALSDLDQFPIPGTWSIRQIIIHLADSDLVISDRIKRVIASDRSTERLSTLSVPLLFAWPTRRGALRREVGVDGGRISREEAF